MIVFIACLPFFYNNKIGKEAIVIFISEKSFNSVNPVIFMEGDPLKQDKIELLKNIKGYIPPAVRFIRQISDYLNIPSYISILVVCLIPYFIGTIIALISAQDLYAHTIFCVRLNIYMITVGAFLLIAFIHKKFIDISSEIIYPISSVEDLERIRQSYVFLFSGKPQYYFCIILSIVTLLTILLFLRLPFSGYLYIYYAIYAITSLFLACGGIWITVGLLYFANKYAQCTSIRFNIIHPQHTIGIKHLASISSTWGICFSLEAVFVLIGLWACPWAANYEAIFYVSFFWTIFVFFMTLITSILPKYIIRRLIRRGERLRAYWLQHLLEQSKIDYNEGVNVCEREQIINRCKDYSDACKVIAFEPNSSINIRTYLELTGSLLVPVVIFTMQNYTKVRSLINDIWSILK